MNSNKDSQLSSKTSSSMARFFNPLFTLILFASSLSVQVQASIDRESQSVQKLLAKLVEANTTNPPGNEARAIRIGAQYLKEAGIPYEILPFGPGRENLVARLKATKIGKGSGGAVEKPLLLLSHIDVVSAENQPWSSNPHQLTEKGEYLYGRGLADDLGSAAVTLETLVFIKKSGAKLKRDVILAWTGDEESGGGGIKHLIKNHLDKIDAGLAINEGDGVRLDEAGKPRFVGLQVAEKAYQDLELIARGQTGHASVPVKDNAIERLARALQKIAQHPPTARLLPVTRAYFKERSKVEPPELAAAMRALGESEGSLPPASVKVVEANPHLAALLRTTCVPTQLNAGTNPNALPAEARANLNCRALPDEKMEDLLKRIAEVIDDPQVEVRFKGNFAQAGPSPLEGDGPNRIRKVIGEIWPNIPVIPSMSTGATDSRHLRAVGIPAYGLCPIAITEKDSERYHGIDERIPKRSIKEGMEFFHRLVLELAAQTG